MSAVRSIKGLLSETVAAVRTRLALFGLEWAQARADLWRQGLLMIFGAVLVFMGLLLLTLAVILFVWDTPYRILAVFVLAILYSIMGVVMLWMAKRAVSEQGAQPFAATIEELTRDADQLANWAQGESAASAATRKRSEQP